VLKKILLRLNCTGIASLLRVIPVKGKTHMQMKQIVTEKQQRGFTSPNLGGKVWEELGRDLCNKQRKRFICPRNIY